jgi:2-iminobutanoate/2-iminopropanoate deaminase
MTKPTVIVTNAAPAAVGPYSQGMRLGPLVFCSGQIPIDPSGNIPATVVEQTHQSLRNVVAVLEAGGASLRTTVKITVFLKNMNDSSP